MPCEMDKTFVLYVYVSFISLHSLLIFFNRFFRGINFSERIENFKNADKGVAFLYLGCLCSSRDSLEVYRLKEAGFGWW